MKTAIRITLLATLSLLGLGAQAASITLQPSQATVQQGTNFTVALLLDARDAPGNRPGLFGGQVVIDFDPTLLSFTGFSTPYHLYEPVVVGASGTRQTVSLGFENAGENGVAGTFSFTVTGTGGIGGRTTAIGIADADDFMGSFINYVSTYKAFYPTFTGTSLAIQAVPLPGAAWLMLTAIGLGATAARRRSTPKVTAGAR